MVVNDIGVPQNCIVHVADMVTVRSCTGDTKMVPQKWGFPLQSFNWILHIKYKDLLEFPTIVGFNIIDYQIIYFCRSCRLVICVGTMRVLVAFLNASLKNLYPKCREWVSASIQLTCVHTTRLCIDWIFNKWFIHYDVGFIILLYNSYKLNNVCVVVKW